MNRIYISGIGTYTSAGYGFSDTCDNIRQGKSTIPLKKDWSLPEIGEQYFGEPPAVDLKEELAINEVMPPMKYSSYGMLACKLALKDAGLEGFEERESIGMVIDTSSGTSVAVEDYLTRLYKFGLHKASPILFTRTVANSALGDISRLFTLRGPSSLLFNESSLCYGLDLLKKGVCKMVICGSVESYNDYYVLSEKETGGLLDADKPLEDSLKNTPDIRRRVLGEGAAFVVLETEESLRQRGRIPYASLVDYASSFDVLHVDDTAVRSEDVLQRNLRTLKEEIRPSDTILWASAYLSDIQMDRNETGTIKSMFPKNDVRVFRHKQYTGDMKSASNTFGVALLAKALQDGKADMGIANTNQDGGASTLFLLTK